MLFSILVGLIAGWLAGQVMKGGFSVGFDEQPTGTRSGELLNI